MYVYKVKDNIDMKILEKYDFKYDEDSELYYCYLTDYDCLHIWEDNRKIMCGTQCCEQWNFSELCDYDSDMISDLIEDGIVERQVMSDGKIN